MGIIHIQWLYVNYVGINGIVKDVGMHEEYIVFGYCGSNMKLASAIRKHKHINPSIMMQYKTNPSDEECAKQDCCSLCIYKFCNRDLKDMGYAL